LKTVIKNGMIVIVVMTSKLKPSMAQSIVMWVVNFRAFWLNTVMIRRLTRFSYT
jgi:hypothetical protein